jgi:hypothetical protein
MPAVVRAERPVTSDGPFVPDPVSVTRYAKGWRYPQAGWIVVHVEGEPYDRGFQHGKLLATEIVDYIDAIAANRSPQSPHQAWRDLRILCNSLFLRRYDPEYLEEMKGIADGAAAEGAKFDGRRVDLIDIVTINSDIEAAYIETGLEASATGLDRMHFHGSQYSQPRARPHEHCSAFVATGPATADGKIVLGHITMSDIESVPHYNVWLDIEPAGGHRVVMQTYPGGIQSGLDYYINDGGLVVAETTIRQTRFNPEGKPIASRIRRAMQYADSIDKAVELLSDSSNGLYTNQWLLADIKTNEVAMFELGTEQSRLWRSSRNEWLDGTAGFYWGCNNSRDVNVLKETVADLGGKPANLVHFPRRRDKAWLELFERHTGKIGEAFAFEAFESSPLAAFPSCDAKFTTSEMAGRLESWALFGPPRGRTWEPTAEDRKKYPPAKPLVSNDWTVVRAVPPAEDKRETEVADLEHFPDDDEEDEATLKFDSLHPFAWRGTLLPKTSGDIWLAAAFAEYEHVVALENALRREADDASLRKATAKDNKPTNSSTSKKKSAPADDAAKRLARGAASSGAGPLSSAARDLVDLAHFAHESRWMAAKRRLGHDLPLKEIVSDPAHNEWYDIAVGKGVMLLAALRKSVGPEAFDRLMDEYGQAHAGTEVTTDEFVEHFRKGAGKPARDVFGAWLDRQSPELIGDAWTIYSFEAEPERSLIVFGTLGDRAAQREAAEQLQRTLARRFSNLLIPIKSDIAVDDSELREVHILLVGRPATNRISARCAKQLPVAFGPGSFTVRDEVYAHPESAVIVAGENPLNPRFSTVIYGGLGAAATWKCVQHLETEELPPPQIILMPAGKKVSRFRVPARSVSTVSASSEGP